MQTRACAWDVAATTLLVAEAGGTSGNPDGSTALIRGPRVFSAGPRVHADVLDALAGCPVDPSPRPAADLRTSGR